MKIQLLSTSALILGSLAAPVAVSQEAEETSARTLETVTVTATKREQTLQDVPVAVSVVDNSVIEKAQIIDLSDLQSVVPSFNVGQLQSSANTNFIIRGFGNGANNAGIEPSVGVFIDGVYRSRSAAQIADLPNLQRVEVLRGPQSTLFGKNASAGVVSIVTSEPQFEFGGNIEGTVSNFNGYRAKGYVTGPISDTLAFSLGGSYNVRDGYATDLASGTETNERNRYGIRGELLFTPQDNMNFRLIGDYDVIDENCCVAANLVNGPTGGIIQAIGGNLEPENPFSYDVFYNFPSTNEIENGGLSLQGDIDFDGFTFTTITAYRLSERLTNADSDFTSADLVRENVEDVAIDTFTQEFRLTSTGDGNVDWQVGAFYFDETVEIDNSFLYGDDFRNYANFLVAGLGAPGAIDDIEAGLGLPVGSAFQQPGQGLTEEFGQDNTALSVFGSLDFHLSDQLTATVGLNYTNDEKDAFGNVVSTDAFSGLDLVNFSYAAGLIGQLGALGVDVGDPASIGAFIQGNPQTYATIQQGVLAGANAPTNPVLGLTDLQFLPPFLNFPNAAEGGSTNDEEVTYNLRLAYDASDNFNVYLSYATGFKASSWNLSRDSRPLASAFTPGNTVVDPFTGQVLQVPPPSAVTNAGLAVTNLSTGSRFASPEVAEVIEIGVKASFDTFAINLALFDQSIEGFQSNVFTGTGFALANAGEQSTQGLEVDMTWNPIEQLTLSFAGTFLDPFYDSFPDAAEGDLSGTVPSGIAKTSTSTAVLYEFGLGNGWDAFVRTDWQYESDNDFFDGGPTAVNNILFDDAFTREVDQWNASFGIETEGGLGVTVWGRNIFDHERITTAFPSVAQAGSISGYPNQPATYGVTVRKQF